MNVTRLTLSGFRGRGNLVVDQFSPRLNVLSSPPRGGKTAVSQLLAQLLYGSSTRFAAFDERRHEGPFEGAVHVADQTHRFALRRRRNGTPAGQLTISAADGATADARTMRQLLGEAPPRVLSAIYAIDFAAEPRVEDLFAPEFAREFNASLARQSATSPEASSGRNAPQFARDAGPERSISGRRFDELIARRDELALRLENQLSGRRQMSSDMQQAIAKLEQGLADRNRQRDSLLAELQRLQAEQVGLHTRLRYYSLESIARRPQGFDPSRDNDELAAVDAELSRCRQTLADLQDRDAAIRRQLAENHADGAPTAEDSLADQRAALGVIERLLDDLDAETALLARAADAKPIPAASAHARISPVADMLRQQLYALCGQVTEQERAVSRQRLKAETRQVSRAQTDLAEQLEQLLETRQALLHRQRISSQGYVPFPLAPSAGHCQCEHHSRFVIESDAALVGRGDRMAQGEIARRDAQGLDLEIARIEEELVRLNDAIAQDQRQWEQLQRNRARLLGPAEIERLRIELEQLEAEIAKSLACRCEPTHAEVPAGWRASDILARLTDGRLMQIRSARDPQEGEVVDRQGRRVRFAELNGAERDQAYLAVALALAVSHAAAGRTLPLVLDEPFLRQTPADAAAMAGVLAAFAAVGHQVILATANREAVERLAGFGANIIALDATPAEQPQRTPIVEPASQPRTTLRLVRSTTDGPAPQRRAVASWDEDQAERNIYYLADDASLADFPVLGNETAAKFKAIGLSTVGEMLAANPEQVSASLGLPSVTPAIVRLWQTHMRLMCFVPGVSLNDAQLLAACRLETPDELATADVDEVAAAVESFLASDRGRRFAAHSDRYSREQLKTWKRAADERRDRWRRSPACAAWKQHGRREGRPLAGADSLSVPARELHRANRSDSPATTRQRDGAIHLDRSRRQRTANDEAKTRKSSATLRPRRFLLEPTSPVVDAPAIGEKTAAALAKSGIRTVADLLACDPASVADELTADRIVADKLRDWQNAARLACSIPEMRGYAAVLLVACGLTAPQQVAGASAAELADRIARYCRTAEGQRILRNSPAPTAEKVGQWIANAGHMRTLGAA